MRLAYICSALSVILFVFVFYLFDFNHERLLLHTVIGIATMLNKNATHEASIELQSIMEVLRSSPMPIEEDVSQLRAFIASLDSVFLANTPWGPGAAAPRVHRRAVARGVRVPRPSGPFGRVGNNGIDVLCVQWPKTHDLDANGNLKSAQQNASESDEQQEDDERVILALFSGGFVGGSPENEVAFYARLSRRTRATVYAPRYGRAPETNAPLSSTQDALIVFNWLREVIGVKKGRIGVIGASAGGGLAALLVRALHAKRRAAEVASVTMLSPWLDLSLEASAASIAANGEPSVDPITSADSLRFYSRILKDGLINTTIGKLKRGNHVESMKDPRVSALYDESVFDEHYPPLFVAVSPTESLRDDGVKYARAAQVAKVREAVLYMPPNRDLPHIWPFFTFSEGVEDLAVISHWISKQFDDYSVVEDEKEETNKE